jgi:hypothetical protein
MLISNGICSFHRSSGSVRLLTDPDPDCTDPPLIHLLAIVKNNFFSNTTLLTKSSHKDKEKLLVAKRKKYIHV